MRALIIKGPKHGELVEDAKPVMEIDGIKYIFYTRMLGPCAIRFLYADGFPDDERDCYSALVKYFEGYDFEEEYRKTSPEAWAKLTEKKESQ